MIAHAEFQNVIEIDSNHNVIYDFSVWTPMSRNLSTWFITVWNGLLEYSAAIAYLQYRDCWCVIPNHLTCLVTLDCYLRAWRWTFWRTFNSLGRAPALEFERYMNKYCHKCTYNCKQLQSIASRFCGHYCAFFCILGSRGIDMMSFVHYFTEDRPTGLNDVIVYGHICSMQQKCSKWDKWIHFVLFVDKQQIN